jgi:hypothetical protein
MRASKIEQVYRVLSCRKDGFTWKELLENFPRQTLNRHLKNLIGLGAIEKIEEPRQAERRGRLSMRYRIVQQQGVGFLGFPVPNMRVKDKEINGKIERKWVVGTEVRNSKCKAEKHFREKGDLSQVYSHRDLKHGKLDLYAERMEKMKLKDFQSFRKLIKKKSDTN